MTFQDQYEPWNNLQNNRLITQNNRLMKEKPTAVEMAVVMAVSLGLETQSFKTQTKTKT